jgi:hypothetical protein
MKEKYEQIVLGLVAILCIIISILDWLSWLPANIVKVPNLILLTLGLISGYLVLERRGKLDKMEKSIVDGFKETIISLKGASITHLEDASELFNYVASRLEEANSSVDDLTWAIAQPPVTSKAHKEAFQRYLSSVDATVSRHGVTYREVATFPNRSRVHRARDLASKGAYGYQLRCYEVDLSNPLPVMEFIIIDKEEVILGVHWGMKSLPPDCTFLGVRHPLIVAFFQEYYEAIWLGSKVIKKQGAPLNAAILDALEQQLP